MSDFARRERGRCWLGSTQGTQDLLATIDRTMLACAASLLIALMAPAGAHAAKADADHDDGVVLYEAADDEFNVVALLQTGDTFSITDAGTTTIVPSNHCASLLGTANCTLADSTRVQVNTLDEDDTVSSTTTTPATIAGGPGNDVLAAGPADDRLEGGDGHDTMAGAAGVDTYVGGKGADRISSRDGIAEIVECGGGEDTVDADGADVLTSCEIVAVDGLVLPPLPSVTDPGAGGTGDGAGGDAGSGDDVGTTSSPTGPGVLLPPSPLTQAGPRWAVVHLVCSVAAVEGCFGEIVLLLGRGGDARRDRATLSRARHKARQRRIGRARFRIEAGKPLDQRVHINARGHAVIRSKRRQRGRLRIVHRDAAGNRTGVTTRDVVFTARKWGRRKARRRR